MNPNTAHIADPITSKDARAVLAAVGITLRPIGWGHWEHVRKFSTQITTMFPHFRNRGAALIADAIGQLPREKAVAS